MRKVLFGTFLLLAIAAGGGIILWQLLPERHREVVSSAIEDIEDGLQNSGKNASAPPPTYTFMQCTNATKCCNGLESNCDMRIHDILYAGIHNANADAQSGYRIAPNHLYHLESSLDYGYRAISMDIGKCDGALKLVHGFCKLGTRDPYEVFTNINTWLDNNPTEILLIVLEVNDKAGDEKVYLSDINDMFSSVSGFSEKLWSKAATAKNWPTLQELIDVNERVLFFTYNGEHCYEPNVICPTGFMDWFRYATETPYTFINADEVRNITNSCNATRGRPTASLYALNVFVTLPSLDVASETLNTKEFLQQHISDCTTYNNDSIPNVVWVDFWDEGDLPEVVQIHNDNLSLQKLRNSTTGD